MTITISEQAYDELFEATVERSQHPDPDDLLDVMYKFPQPIGQGYRREIELRPGLVLTILDMQLHERMILVLPEREQWLEYHFHFSGEHQDEYTSIGDRQYIFCGSGLAPQETLDAKDRKPFLEISIHMAPELLRSFTGDAAGQLPPQLQPLIRQSDQQYYCRCGTATLTMQSVAQQILQCPYRGITKRLYLESKVLDLMGILIRQEVEMQDDKSNSLGLKPDVVERAYHAREILWQRLDNPPSLVELAQMVGLNSRALKEGFRACFGQPVFSYLHQYRLEQARQLLETEDMKVSEVAEIVGFGDRSYFAKAFRKKFGFNPKDYQMQRKSSSSPQKKFL